MIVDGVVLTGRFLERKNRFLVLVALKEGPVLAHLPNPGRMRELFRPGAKLLLTEATGESRKTHYEVLGVLAGGEKILLDTRLSNSIAEEGIGNGSILPFRGYRVAKREFSWKGSRFDFLLERSRSKCILEVKASTLLKGSLALFPDAPSSRGRRHLKTLALARRYGYRAAVLFLIHRRGAGLFAANGETDPRFSEGLSQAIAGGVEAFAYECGWQDDSVFLTRRIPVAGSSSLRARL